MRCFLGVLVIVALLAPAAMAEYLNQPPWQGTGGFETYQGWEFDTDLAATTVDNAYGVPTLDADTNGAWVSEFEGRTGLFYFDGWTDYPEIGIPNADNANPRKEIWLQITYFAWDGFPGMNYYIDGWGGEGTGFAGPGVAPQIVESTANGDWVYEAIHWYIEPNPEGETITLESSFGEDMYIDQLHVDTICIPEPASLGLLALGGLAVLRRRR